MVNKTNSKYLKGLLCIDSDVSMRPNQFPSSTMKETRIEYFIRPTRGSWFCIPSKTNYSSLLIMGNVGQLRAAETRSTASERNGGGAAGKVRRRRRMRRSAPALCIAPLPPPLFLQHQYRVRNRIRVLESERAAGHHCTATEDTPSQNQEQGKGKKAWNSAEGKNRALFFWNHRNLWEIKQEPDICQ